jgi:predicted TIM-barrel fold metal-dependent hydrolase
MTVIDAQIHVWSAETPERSWRSGGAARVHRPTLLGKDELLREMDAAGVDRAIIVPLSWEGDRNHLAMAAALSHPEWIPSPISIKPGLWLAALPNGSAGRWRQYDTLPR